jgi:antitoxin component of RelBE/YafQ-DinJ toxin-antitoxin module
MSTVWRLRIDRNTLTRANRVTERLGASTQEMVRVFVSKIAESGRVPLELEAGTDAVSLPWELRAAALENFYDPAKTW